jgi:hypothetical protein
VFVLGVCCFFLLCRDQADQQINTLHQGGYWKRSWQILGTNRLTVTPVTPALENAGNGESKAEAPKAKRLDYLPYQIGGEYTHFELLKPVL